MKENKLAQQYLDLLMASLLNELYIENEAKLIFTFHSMLNQLPVNLRQDGSKPGAEALQAAFGEALAAAGLVRPQGVASVAYKADDFKYVATLGYFTPRSLPGATVVDAKAVDKLLKAGATYIDTRTEAEFKAGHVPGSKLVPYVEKSAKEADYIPSLDQFDVSKLGADRTAELVFACNGPECWKSFKASQAAIKAGFTRVHWFRGGLPEWRSSGMKYDAAAAQ